MLLVGQVIAMDEAGDRQTGDCVAQASGLRRLATTRQAMDGDRGDRRPPVRGGPSGRFLLCGDGIDQPVSDHGIARPQQPKQEVEQPQTTGSKNDSEPEEVCPVALQFGGGFRDAAEG